MFYLFNFLFMVFSSKKFWFELIKAVVYAVLGVLGNNTLDII